jgi:hypothetical protein
MRRLPVVGLLLAAIPLLLFTQASAAKTQAANKVKRAGGPVWSVAIDGPRIAYASGGFIHIWNEATGATSQVRGKYANALHTANASQLAIAGKRVAWIKDQQFGNTEEGEKLYTAPIGGKARLVDHVYRYARDDASQTNGGWIEGLVGSGNVLAVSTWRSQGMLATDQQLSLISPAGLGALAGGPGAIVSQAVGGGHIADLQTSPWSTSTGVSIYSTSGELLNEFSVDAAAEIALIGDRLAVLTPAPTPAIEIYDWATGALEHTWPAQGAATATPGPNQVGHVEAYGGIVLYSVYSQFVGGNETLHVLNPATGTDAVAAMVKGFGSNREWAIGSSGLVYVRNTPLNSTIGHGKLVFVPTATLEALLGQ